MIESNNLPILQSVFVNYAILQIVILTITFLIWNKWIKPKMIDKLAKYQKHLLGLAIFLSLFAVSITIRQGQIKLNLANYPLLMILLVVISIIFLLIYIRIEHYRIEHLSQEIKSRSNEGDHEFEVLLSELTTRQKEVYEQVLSGKSNKEIMAALFIEQSTLKTHINQIYKKLNVKNRKELKSKLKY